MMKIKSITKYALYVVISLAASQNQAFANDERNVVKVPIPKGTKATILVLDEKGEILRMMDERGMEAIECELCNGETHEDPHCKKRLAEETAHNEKYREDSEHSEYSKNRRRPLCASLAGGRTTLNNWTTFSHIGHHRNPDCRAIQSRGVIRLLPSGCYH